MDIEAIVDYALGWVPEYPSAIDWDDLLYRIEEVFDIDLESSVLSDDIKMIKKAVNTARREA